MNTTAISFQHHDPSSVLDRHTTRRVSGIPTISLLIGPIGAGCRTLRQWASRSDRCVIVAMGSDFPLVQWVGSVIQQVDLPVAAVHSLARRADRVPDEFLAAWRVKTSSDREQFWDIMVAEDNDDILEAIAALASERFSPNKIASLLCNLGERIVPLAISLAPSASWPAVLFVAGSASELSALVSEATKWAFRVPALPIAVTVPEMAWAHYLIAAPDSRGKALLREGELTVPAIDAATLEQSLTEAGAGAGPIAVLVANEADPILVESAIALVRATAVPPPSEAEDNRARSIAEQFLFEFLESLPETTGRFALNATLDFSFGPRLVEVDLLCREPPIALEIDGYFHFRDAVAYRRDRAKDWELQRRGFLVLRFLAEDVIPQLEMIRDRILDAMTQIQPGVPP